MYTLLIIRYVAIRLFSGSVLVSRERTYVNMLLANVNTLFAQKRGKDAWGQPASMHINWMDNLIS